MFHISQKYIRVKEGDRTDVLTIRTIIDQEIDPLADTEVQPIEVEEVLAEIIDQITGVGYGIILVVTTNRTITGEIMDGTIIEITQGKTIGKIGIEIQDLGIDVVVEMDVEITTVVIQERTLNETGGILVETVGRDNCIHELEEKKTEEIVID